MLIGRQYEEYNLKHRVKIRKMSSSFKIYKTNQTAKVLATSINTERVNVLVDLYYEIQIHLDVSVPLVAIRNFVLSIKFVSGYQVTTCCRHALQCIEYDFIRKIRFQ